jgi:hypothetical protein
MVYDSITTYHLWKSDLERYLKTLFPTADIEVTFRVPRSDDQRGGRPSLTPRCTQMQPNSNNFRLSIPRYLTQVSCSSLNQVMRTLRGLTITERFRAE